MDRQAVYADMEQTLGVVPSFFKAVPDRTLDLEWELYKRVELEPGPVPNKYRELIGLGIAASIKCRYCVLYHTEVAKVFGATDEEIEDALHFGKSMIGWSEYINGLNIDYEQFKQEVRQACDHVRQHMQQSESQSTQAAA